ncbi:hypothetical protein FRB94_008181 [Tulasnella sp. JGI-2019a]|nr:hypothetical protein FRB94_008181 [Tulasnella sp. JGI-2019a]
MYQTASGLVPFVPTSAAVAAGGQVVDDPSKVEQPWIGSSQSDISPPYLTSSSQQPLQQQPSSNLASQSDLGNPSEGASSSSHPQRIVGGGGGGGLVSPEKSLPGLPPGAGPPIPGGIGGGRSMTPDAALARTQSPPPQYEG